MTRLLAIVALISSFLLVGCGSQNSSDPEPNSSESQNLDTAEEALATDTVEESETESVPVADDSSETRSEEPVVYRNDQGQIVCPVMNVILTSADLADGSQEYLGKLYYFSTKRAAALFEENPDTYKK